MSKNAVIYVRSSAANAAESLGLQISRCAALAGAHGAHISQVYLDTVSRANDPREELDRLLVDCEAGQVHVIYVSARDRIARDPAQLKRITAKLEEHRVEVIYLTDDIGIYAETV